MYRILINNAIVEGDIIRYRVSEEGNFGFLQQTGVDLWVKYRGGEGVNIDLDKVPQSMLLVPISLYLLPLIWFFNVELVIPEMDEDLYNRLSTIHDAYSKLYGPFKKEWGGKVSVGRTVKNLPIKNPRYDKVVFFSGGVDACHAGINNIGRKSLLVSIPSIEYSAKNEGALHEKKFTLIENFSKFVDSDWLLISNNFDLDLYNFQKINEYLSCELCIDTPAFRFNGYRGTKYLPNMCCVAPIAYQFGVQELVMGSSFEQIEDIMQVNLDGANPDLSNSLGFANIVFAEQDGLMVRRSKKVAHIIDWCNSHGAKIKMQACFDDSNIQCGYCFKCVRTQLNILCARENPKNWGFDNFSEEEFTKYVISYSYRDRNPCWLWDIVDSIEKDRKYPYCNDLLHWLKKVGYKKYIYRSAPNKGLFFRRICRVHKYPFYIKTIVLKLLCKK